MSSYKLHLRYVYTFYSFNELLECDSFDEYVTLGDNDVRFTLHDQEDGSFVASRVTSDHIGKYAILTFPGKDNLVVHENDEVELAYDEYFDAMGDDNHNVYEGTVTLEFIKGDE